MNILVVGGAGYVGSHAVKLLVEAGHQVCVYDNLVYGHPQATLGVRLVDGELSEGPRLTALLRELKTEAVFHFAAYAAVGESVIEPAKYYQNNIVGSLSLLDAMRAADVRKIVFSSTTAVYGIPKSMPINEDMPRLPVNPYGFTKMVIEQALDDYARAYDFAYAALRYFNASGASPDGDIGEDHTPESHLIPIVLQVALGQRKDVTIFGDDYPTPDGTCIRDYVHVNDLGRAHLAALDRLMPGVGLQLNLGTGRGHSVREVIEACRKVTGHAIPTVMGARRAGDPPELIADPSRAKKQLGWQPRFVEIADIVETAWAWHRSHPNGYA